MLHLWATSDKVATLAPNAHADALRMMNGQGLLSRGEPTLALSTPLSCLLSTGGLRTDVRLVVPPSLLRIHRHHCDVPIGGQVRYRHIETAMETLRDQIDEPDGATLLLQPSRFVLDGVQSLGEPLGHVGDRLVIDFLTARAPLKSLGRWEACISASGGRLVGVTLPHLGILHAASELHGAFLWVGTDDTIIASMAQGVAVAAASCPVGRRHFIQDGLAAIGADGAELVQDAVDRFLRGDAVENAALSVAFEARAEELVAWIRGHAEQISRENPLMICGAMSADFLSRRGMETKFPDLLDANLPLEEENMLPLFGAEWAADQVDDDIGHAFLWGTPAGPAPLHLRVQQWLRTHF